MEKQDDVLKKILNETDAERKARKAREVESNVKALEEALGRKLDDVTKSPSELALLAAEASKRT